MKSLARYLANQDHVEIKRYDNYTNDLTLSGKITEFDITENDVNLIWTINTSTNSATFHIPKDAMIQHFGKLFWGHQYLIECEVTRNRTDRC